MRFDLFGPYHVLDEPQLQQVHEASLRLLSEMGAKIESERLLNLLDRCGCQVSHSSFHVRFPSQVVEQALAAAQEQYRTLRPPPWPHQVNKTTIVAQPGGYCIRCLDRHTHKHRSATRQDLREACAIIDRTEQCPAGPVFLITDCPTQTNDIHHYAEWSKYSAKGSRPYQLNVGASAWLEELGMVVTGKTRDQLVADGFLNAALYWTPPFQMPAESAQRLLEVYDCGYAVNWGGSMVVTGASCPITVAASVALSNAHYLASLVLLQAVGPRQCLFEVSDWTAPVGVDLATSAPLYADPRRLLANVASMDLSRYYQMPKRICHVGPDAAGPGVQFAVERMFATMLLLALHEYDEVALRCGVMGPACFTGSVPQMLIDVECARMIQRLLDGIDVDEQRLGVDLMIEKGVTGFFLDDPHTVEYMREESWIPELFERRTPVSGEVWEDPVYGRACERVEQMLSESPPQVVLTDDQVREIDRIVQAADVAAV